jgi:hypothetical protein
MLKSPGGTQLIELSEKVALRIENTYDRLVEEAPIGAHIYNLIVFITSFHTGVCFKGFNR